MMGVLILIFCFLILLQNFIKARITEHEAETSKFFGQNFAERKKEHSVTKSLLKNKTKKLKV